MLYNHGQGPNRHTEVKVCYPPPRSSCGIKQRPILSRLWGEKLDAKRESRSKASFKHQPHRVVTLGRRSSKKMRSKYVNYGYWAFVIFLDLGVGAFLAKPWENDTAQYASMTSTTWMNGAQTAGNGIKLNKQDRPSASWIMSGWLLFSERW